MASVPHGGELLGPDHLRVVTQALDPDRIGHGVRAIEDPSVLAELLDRAVAFEVCPASNVALGVYPTLAAVPIRALYAAGAQIALGADDPLLFGSRLLDQYRTAREVHHFSDVELADLARASITASRASASSQARMLRGVTDWLRSPPQPALAHSPA